MQSHLYHSTPPRGIPKTITLGISCFLMALPGDRPYPIVNNQIQIPWQGIIRYPVGCYGSFNKIPGHNIANVSFLQSY